ncbi:hypothetical protein BpHYR1_000673 [Brachionus plicatilis]|uniref:Uncharacterized protein n=1 Tax=Brachionus plicatilis TaxID=10195 RepID=A0A3M7PSJ1_BRAPC|nr:hypothetical protein BpHYR1_000673 [Brachionus plicatilis]
MVHNKLSNLNVNEKLSNKQGIWGRLAEEFFKEPFSIGNALYLSKNWERNRNSYRTSIKNKESIFYQILTDGLL